MRVCVRVSVQWRLHECAAAEDCPPEPPGPARRCSNWCIRPPSQVDAQAASKGARACRKLLAAAVVAAAASADQQPPVITTPAKSTPDGSADVGGGFLGTSSMRTLEPRSRFTVEDVQVGSCVYDVCMVKVLG